MNKTLFSLTVATTLSTGLLASSSEIEQLKAQLEALQQKTDLLIEETADIKSGSLNYTVIDSSKTVNGMGDAASKIYYSKSPLSIGGYGEMYYANPDNGDAVADVYRFVPYIGYKFSDNIILNTELEFEHGDEITVEFMYLDFLINSAFNVRLGHVLVPMGLVNIRHEPTLFNTVQRPDIERQLIPSTWHETGALVYGDIGESGLSYNIGIVNALNLHNDGSDTSWIRSGRMGAHKATMNKVAGVGRLDYSGINGLLVGASAYYGDAAQGDPSGSNAFIYDFHGAYELSGFKFRGVYTAVSVDSAQEWNESEAATDGSGYYVNAEYDILAALGRNDDRLPVFVQYEAYDTTEQTLGDTDPNNALTVLTAGVNYFPHDQVVLKLDYAMKAYDNASKKDVDTLSFGIGFVF